MEMTVDKRILRIFSKLGLLLVVIGFFMPISCDINGFEFTRAFLINTDAPINSMVENPVLIGFMGLIMFLASCIGIIIMIIIFYRRDISVLYDWILTIVTIGSGLIAFSGLKDIFERSFQIGGYFIISGWIISLLCMILTKVEKGLYFA
jgi:hypothetical protein